MSNWNFDMNQGNESNKAEFTKFIPGGVTRIRVLDDAPHVRWTHWIMKDKRSANCPGKGCPICEIRKQQKANQETPTYNISRRFAMNIFNFDTGKVEIMEQGITFFEDLRDIREDLLKEGKTLTDAILRVKRRGAGKDDTSYRIDVDSVEPTNLEQYAEQVIDLADYFKPHTPEQLLRIVSGESWDEVMKTQVDEAETEEDFEVK